MLACRRRKPGQLPQLGRLGSCGGSGRSLGCPRTRCCRGLRASALEFSSLCCSSTPFSPSPSVPSSPSSLPSHPPPPFPVLLPFSLSTPQRLATLNWYHHPEHCPRRKRCCHLTTRISNSTVRCTPTPHWAQHLLEFWWHLDLQHYYLKLMWRPFLQDLPKWDKARAAVGRQGLCLQAVKILGFEAFSCPVD